MSDKKNRLVSEGKFYQKVTDISATAAEYIVQRAGWQISVAAVSPAPTFPRPKMKSPAVVTGTKAGRRVARGLCLHFFSEAPVASFDAIQE